MLEILGFRERHNTAVTSIRRKRNEATRDRPVRLEYVSLDTDPSDPEAHGDGWERFCESVGGRNAMAWWAYVLQFCGLHAADSGVIRIDRKNFGRLVLSRNTDPVSDRDGIKCYDALIAAGMAREVDRLQEPVVQRAGATSGDTQGAAQGPTQGDTRDAPRGEPQARTQGATPGATQGQPSGYPHGTPEGAPQGQPQGAGVLVLGPGSSNTPLPPAERGSGCAAAGSSSSSNAEPTQSEWAAARVIADALVRQVAGVRCLTPTEDAELLSAIRTASSGSQAERAAAAARREELFAEDLRRRKATIDGIERGDVAVVRWAVALLGEHAEIVDRIRSAQRVTARDRRGRGGVPLPAPVAAAAIPQSVASAPPVARSAPTRAAAAAPAPHTELPAMTPADREHVVSALTSQVRTGGANATPARALLGTPDANRNLGWWARAVAILSTGPARPGALDRELVERDLARLAESAIETPDVEQARALLRVQEAYRWGEWYRIARNLIEDAARRAEEQRTGAPAGAA